MKIFIKILFIFLWVATAAGTVVLMGFANTKHESKKITAVRCTIDYSGKTPLLSETDVLHHVKARFGKLTSLSIGNADIAAMTSHIAKIPYLENVNVKVNVDGIVEIKARQSLPVVRFITEDGVQRYIAENGRILPLNPFYPYKSQIATGQIAGTPPVGQSIFRKHSESGKQDLAFSSLNDIYYLATIINADTVLDALVEQIYVTSQNELQIVTKAGTHVVELGDTTNLRSKLENLKYFYKDGLVKTGWNKYSKVNLRYQNQIVCTK